MVNIVNKTGADFGIPVTLRPGDDKYAIPVTLTGQIDVKSYGAKGDGVTDDRAAISATFAYAIANMPAVVYFPPGDYGISGGIEIKPTQGSRGLMIMGAGADVTRIRFNGSSELVSNQFIALKIIPSVLPSPKDTLSEYIHDVTVKDIGFYDDNPYLHQSAIAIASGTGTHDGAANAAILTDSGASFPNLTSVDHIIRNTTDGSSAPITANDGTTITSVLHAGTDNDWDNGDGYLITLASNVEESHAVSMQYVINAHIINCAATDIGDEAFNLTFCRRGSISNNDCINCPSIASGGGAITVQHGSTDMVVSNNNLWGNTTPGTISALSGGSGINIERVTELFDIDNVVIANNNIRDFGEEGILFTCSSAGTLSNVTVSGNNIKNCNLGIYKKGQAQLENLNIVGNNFEDMVGGTAYGIRFPAGVTETINVIICDNNITSCATGGMELNLTGALLSNNTFKSCPRGIYIFNGVNINISSGLFDSCGGALLEEIEDISAVSTTHASNIKITNSSTSNSSIKGVAYVDNVSISGSNAATQQQFKITGALNITNCTVDGGIRLLASATDGVIANNKLSWVDTGPSNAAAIELASGNSNYSITGNSIDVSGSTNNQYCISLLSGANNNIVTGNNCQSKTAGAANAINDAGTTNIADTTTANKTT